MAISSFFSRYANRYTAALLPASYLLWSFEEFRIALLPHYVHVPPYQRTKLRSRADAGHRFVCVGLCVLQHILLEDHEIRACSPYNFETQPQFRQP